MVLDSFVKELAGDERASGLQPVPVKQLTGKKGRKPGLHPRCCKTGILQIESMLTLSA
jgi:hypothetical protein